MSPPIVVLAGVLLLVLCGSSWGMMEPGLQELVALDEVLRDLRGVLETRPDPTKLVTLTEPLAGVWNESHREEINVSPPSPDVAEKLTGQSARAAPGWSLKRKKRVSPTPPPSWCSNVHLPDYLGKWEQLKYLLFKNPSGCHHHGCCQRKPDPCPYKPEVLVARLSMLEERLRKVDRLEAKVKIYISLLNGIQASDKYPGLAGELGPQGRKGHQGFKGLPGYTGIHGSCRITGHADPSEGPPGPPGNKGNPGPPGDKVCGCDGDKGEPGTPGASRRGPPGNRGLKGQKGERGRDMSIFHG